MTTALATREFAREEVELIKTTICRGATDSELALFLNQCKRTGLDPFTKQIHAVKRWNSKTRREEMAIQVGIDGFRLIADRTLEADGQDGPFWCGKDGRWYDAWLSAEPPLASKVIAYRKGRSHPYTGVARYASYVQTTKEGGPNHFWSRMPDVMLAKCAEALALRKAFPQELSGVYLPEEMGADTAAETPPEAIEHRPAKTAAAKPLPPETGIELRQACESIERVWASKKLCTAGYVFSVMHEWAREEQGWDEPMDEWDAGQVAAGVRELKEIQTRLYEAPVSTDAEEPARN